MNKLEVIQLGSTKFSDFNYEGGGIVDDLKELRMNIDDRDIELLESIIGRVEKLRTALKLTRDDHRYTVSRMEAYADTKCDELRRKLIPTRDLLAALETVINNDVPIPVHLQHRDAIKKERDRIRSIMRECVHGISYDMPCVSCNEQMHHLAITPNENPRRA